MANLKLFSQASRRTILKAAGISTVAILTPALPAWAMGKSVKNSDSKYIKHGFDEVSGNEINIDISSGLHKINGKINMGIAANGSIPGPLVRLKEGQDVTLNVTNNLKNDTSIHWHGLLVPFQYDGVPGVSFPGIKPGTTFPYKFKVRQNGTYWWHSHSGLQEQSGHYGPLVIDPKDGPSVDVDKDFVIVLSEFSPLLPEVIMEKLKKGEGYFNFNQSTFTDDYPLTAKERRMWAKMRMMPTDILDVTASTYTYLINGHSSDDSLEFLFNSGEKVRFRVINASAMTFFNFRIPGLEFEVIGADGQNIEPTPVEEFQIGVAETYDILVKPKPGAHTIVAESMDRSGMVTANLTSKPGMRGEVPPLRKKPLMTMADMGMSMEGHKMSEGSGMEMDMRDTSKLPDEVKVGPGIAMVSANPVNRMGDPGIGLSGLKHKVLNYKMLEAKEPNQDTRTPSRLLEIHLTGNMERYMWSFDGKKFNAVSDQPIRFAYNERVRVKLVNDTMMAHPIHLHGHFFELVNGASPEKQPRKHTVIVQPGGMAQFDLTANEVGDWAFHCHLLYHMHAGMFQIVTVEDKA